jgi:hypothetical protein
MNTNASQLPDGNDQTTQRPDLVPGVPVLLGGGAPGHTLQINPAAFAPPPLDPGGTVTQIINPGPNQTYVCPLSCGLVSRFGTAPNGLIRALDSWQVDFALMKETRLSERFSVEFGVQAFNIFNHVQLGDPSTDNLTLDYGFAAAQVGSTIQTTQSLSPKGNLGLISSTNNFNNNNDNAASPNTGTGLPRQLQFMLRVKF